MFSQRKTKLPTSAGKKPALLVTFDSRLKLEFHGSEGTSNAGLLVYRELDGVLGLTETGENLLSDGRTSKNTRYPTVVRIRQLLLMNRKPPLLVLAVCLMVMNG